MSLFCVLIPGDVTLVYAIKMVNDEYVYHTKKPYMYLMSSIIDAMPDMIHPKRSVTESPLCENIIFSVIPKQPHEVPQVEVVSGFYHLVFGNEREPNHIPSPGNPLIAGNFVNRKINSSINRGTAWP